MKVAKEFFTELVAKNIGGKYEENYCTHDCNSHYIESYFSR